MFWNALVRKGKAAGSTEHDMDAVIAIHNNMNELTWMQVQYHFSVERGSARARARARRASSARHARIEARSLFNTALDCSGAPQLGEWFGTAEMRGVQLEWPDE